MYKAKSLFGGEGGRKSCFGLTIEWENGDGSFVVFGGSTVFLSLAQKGLPKHLKTFYCGLSMFIQQLN